jgi:oligoribonuclease NrnB/cAMP/cGMP phosphodiesterase (DHH superfamily)
MKCFYHKSDLDGHCSGAIVKMRFPECEMIGVDYQDNEDDILIPVGEEIYVVDFSFSAKFMKMMQECSVLHWIDHHKSAIEECLHIEGIKGLRYLEEPEHKPFDKISGCELTWKYIYPETEMPEAVKLLGRYDVWDHSDPNVLQFQYGMRNFDDTLPDSTIWKEESEEAVLWMTTQGLFGILESGKTILQYEKKKNIVHAKEMSFETIFKGLRAVCINKPFSNSKVFDSIWDEEKHDIMIIFGCKPRSFKYSLYSTKDNVDCSEIAKLFGGGGHKGASGFHYNRFLFLNL